MYMKTKADWGNPNWFNNILHLLFCSSNPSFSNPSSEQLRRIPPELVVLDFCGIFVWTGLIDWQHRSNRSALDFVGEDHLRSTGSSTIIRWSDLHQYACAWIRASAGCRRQGYQQSAATRNWGYFSSLQRTRLGMLQGHSLASNFWSVYQQGTSLQWGNRRLTSPPRSMLFPGAFYSNRSRAI